MKTKLSSHSSPGVVLLTVTSAFALFSLSSHSAPPPAQPLNDLTTIATAAKGAPAPRKPVVSPDGKRLIYEVEGTNGTSLWISNTDGSNARSLTEALQKAGKLPAIAENASWHPQKDFVAFEGRDTENADSKKAAPNWIYMVRIADGKIVEHVRLAEGRRPGFSFPNGRTLFCEVTEGSATLMHYLVVGNDPLHPRDQRMVPLRGPIQKVRLLNFTEPALSRDGTGVFFSAGTRLRVAAEEDFKPIMDFIDPKGEARSRVIDRWAYLTANKKSSEDVVHSLRAISEVFGEIERPLMPGRYSPEVTARLLADLKAIDLDGPAKAMWAVSRRDLLYFWALGLLTDRSLKQKEVEGRLSSRIWMTDLFGAALKPVADFKDAPVPQSNPAPASDSRYVFFEAGPTRDRQIYVADSRTQQAVKLTKEGENLAPRLSADNQTLFYESHIRGKKELRRASIDWSALKAELRE